MSPTTNSSASNSFVSPSLITLAICGVNFFKLSIDFSALSSWINPIIAFNTTIAIIIIESM